MAVTFESVSFTYPGADDPALRDVNLAIGPAEITWIFGRLGAGASTLLLAGAGLAPRHTGGRLVGTVSVLGADPARDPSLAGKCAYVTAVPSSQLSRIAETVYQEVAFAPANLGWPRDRIRQAAYAALERMGVAHLADRHPESLSGGELQRVILAAMLALDPQVWFLDEPTSALDGAGRSLLYGLLRERADAGNTILIASEDADALAALADRMVVMADGAPVLDAAPADLLRGEEVWQACGGSTSLAALARAAGDHSAAPAFQPPYPLSLDEAVARWRA